ncbi:MULTISPECIES: hypothetical protein [Methanobacterium]|jgi:hypothetical protein|uniref:Uncharacterized protein n=1 Tax=Methanobacterium veterum TaxID=408577 RepID=A0A9E5A0G4_9EURY|nr:MULTISPECIES: hypothetical protein [Methanobacterium]MCZ3372199.1 hypothetical protein [Methanobacterium veterum]
MIIPIRRKEKAVLDLIVEKSEPGVLRISILNAHPIRNKILIKMIKILKISENARNLDIY